MVTGFDVELLYLARKLGYRIAEVGIQWYYAPGSKVNPVQDTLRLISRTCSRSGSTTAAATTISTRTPSPEATHGMIARLRDRVDPWR